MQRYEDTEMGGEHLGMHFINMARRLMVLIMSFVRVAAWKVMKIIISWRQSSTHRYPMKSEQMRGRVKLFVIPLFDLSTLITLLDCASMCTASLIAILRRFSPTFNFFVWLVSIFLYNEAFVFFIFFFFSNLSANEQISIPFEFHPIFLYVNT